MAKTIKKYLNGESVILFLIILIGFLLRVLFLDKFPVGFHFQEAIAGFRAFSIANTAKDELGRFLPILFTSFQDYQLPLSTYITVPFIKVFGLNEFTTRLPFAIISTLAIYAFYQVTRKIFPENKSIAFWSALFLAINPWAVFLSRTTSEVVLAFHLFLIGFWLLLVANKKRYIVIFAIIFFIASFYSSKVAWFFVTPFLATLFLVPPAKRLLDLPISTGLVTFLILIVFSLPLLFSYFKAPAVSQSLLLTDFSFFSDISTENYINQMRGEAITSNVPFVGRLFFNKSFYIIRLLENFLAHFNPRFLFAAGEGNALHGLKNFGPVLLIFLPVTVTGLVALLKKGDWRLTVFLFWTIFALLPSAFLIPTLNQERFIFLLPIIAFLSAFGISQIRLKLIFAIFVAGLILNSMFVIYDAFLKEPGRVQEDWEVGYNVLSSKLFPKISEADKIYLTDSYSRNPGPILLFYFSSFQQQIWQDFGPTKGFVFRNWINRVANIHIGKVPNILLKENDDKNILFVVKPNELERLSAYKIIDNITGFDQKPLLLIGKFLEIDEKGNPIVE